MKFPSRLNPLEEYFLWDDYPAYPNTIGCRIHLSTPIEAALVDPVTSQVVERHPLARVSVTAKKKPRWIPATAEVPRRQLDYASLAGELTRKIDLDTMPSTQLHWASDPHGTLVNLMTHHAAVDGVGGLQMVFDWLVVYASLLENGTDRLPTLRKLRPELLDQRSRYGFRSWGFLKKIPRQSIGLAGVWEFYRHRPVPLKPSDPIPISNPVPQDFPGLITHEVGRVSDLQKFAESTDATTNDILLTSLFVGIDQWRSEFGFGTEQDMLRIMVPMNLRQFRDRSLPAANRTSLVSIDRRQAQCREFGPLVKGIRNQMNIIQRNELGYTFLHMLNLNSWLPGGIRGAAKPERVAATVLATNLGEPFRRLRLPRTENGKVRVGESVLESFDLIPPLRPHTQASIAFYRYAGRFMLSMIYDNRILEPAEASRLMELISSSLVDQLTDFAATA